MSMSFHEPVMVGPLRWLVLTDSGRISTFLFFVKALHTPYGPGTTLFVQSDLEGKGVNDLFALYAEDVRVAEYLRDEVWNYTVFAGKDGNPPAPVKPARFQDGYDFPRLIEERMIAQDTEVVLRLSDFGPVRTYVRDVNERVREVGAMSLPGKFELTINGRTPPGKLEIGPLTDAPPIGADLQNVWFDSRRSVDA